VLEEILEVGAIPGTTPVHRLWAGTKLLAVLCFGVGLGFAGRLWGFGAVAALLLLAVVAGRISPALLWRGMRPLLLVLLIGALVLLFTLSGKPLLHIGPAVLTDTGLDNAVRFPGMLFLLALAAQVVNRTTAPAESAAALGVLLSPLRRLGLPVDEFLTMVAISLRFLPILAEEITRLRQAQATRGLSAGQGSVENRGRAMEGWIVALVNANIRRADELGDAMAARGYGDPESREFPVFTPHLGALDVFVLALCFGLCMAMIAIR
jgi:energy-coupling factor transport system permease protein